MRVGRCMRCGRVVDASDSTRFIQPCPNSKTGRLPCRFTYKDEPDQPVVPQEQQKAAPETVPAAEAKPEA